MTTDFDMLRERLCIATHLLTWWRERANSLARQLAQTEAQLHAAQHDRAELLAHIARQQQRESERHLLEGAPAFTFTPTPPTL